MIRHAVVQQLAQTRERLVCGDERAPRAARSFLDVAFIAREQKFAVTRGELLQTFGTSGNGVGK